MKRTASQVNGSDPQVNKKRRIDDADKKKVTFDVPEEVQEQEQQPRSKSKSRVTEELSLEQILRKLNAKENEDIIRALGALRSPMITFLQKYKTPFLRGRHTPNAAAADEPATVADQYVTASPECNELFWLLEEHFKVNRSDPVCVEVVRVLETLLAYSQARPQLRGLDLVLSRKVLHSSYSLKALYHHLSGEDYLAVNVTLRFMCQLIQISPLMARQLFESIELSFKAFDRLADKRQNRAVKQHVNFERDARTWYVRLGLSVLSLDDMSLTREALSAVTVSSAVTPSAGPDSHVTVSSDRSLAAVLRPIYQNTFAKIGEDCPELIEEILTVFHDHVLCHKTLNKKVKTLFFNSFILEQLGKLYNHVTVEGRDEGHLVEHVDRFMNALCCHADTGIIYPINMWQAMQQEESLLREHYAKNSTDTRQVSNSDSNEEDAMTAMSRDVSSGGRSVSLKNVMVLKLFRHLKPQLSARQQRLICHVLVTCWDIRRAYLTQLGTMSATTGSQTSMALDPRPSYIWQLNLNFITHLIHDTIAYLGNSGNLLSNRPRDLRAVDHVLDQVYGMLVPHVITRRLLTHGVLHQHRLVSYHVLQLIRVIHRLYSALGVALIDLGHGDESAEQLRVTVTQRLAADLKKRFPDLQTIFALKARVNLTESSHQWPYLEFLAVLRVYLQSFPEEFLANKIDLGKTLLTSLDRAHDHVLGLQLRLLLSAANLKLDAAGQHSLLKWNASISDEAQSSDHSGQTQLSALLQLMSEISSESNSRGVLLNLVRQIMLSSALFDFDHRLSRDEQCLEVITWLQQFGTAPWSRVMQQALTLTHLQPYHLADRLRQISHVTPNCHLSLVSFGALAHHSTLAQHVTSRDEFYARLVHVIAWQTRRPGGVLATALVMHVTHQLTALPAQFRQVLDHVIATSTAQVSALDSVNEHVPDQFTSLLLYLAIALSLSRGEAVTSALRHVIDEEQRVFEQKWTRVWTSQVSNSVLHQFSAALGTKFSFSVLQTALINSPKLSHVLEHSELTCDTLLAHYLHPRLLLNLAAEISVRQHLTVQSAIYGKVLSELDQGDDHVFMSLAHHVTHHVTLLLAMYRQGLVPNDRCQTLLHMVTFSFELLDLVLARCPEHALTRVIADRVFADQELTRLFLAEDSVVGMRLTHHLAVLLESFVHRTRSASQSRDALLHQISAAVISVNHVLQVTALRLLIVFHEHVTATDLSRAVNHVLATPVNQNHVAVIDLVLQIINLALDSTAELLVLDSQSIRHLLEWHVTALDHPHSHVIARLILHSLNGTAQHSQLVLAHSAKIVANTYLTHLSRDRSAVLSALLTADMTLLTRYEQFLLDAHCPVPKYGHVTLEHVLKNNLPREIATTSARADSTLRWFFAVTRAYCHVIDRLAPTANTQRAIDSLNAHYRHVLLAWALNEDCADVQHVVHFLIKKHPLEQTQLAQLVTAAVNGAKFSTSLLLELVNDTHNSSVKLEVVRHSLNHIADTHCSLVMTRVTWLPANDDAVQLLTRVTKTLLSRDLHSDTLTLIETAVRAQNSLALARDVLHQLALHLQFAASLTNELAPHVLAVSLQCFKAINSSNTDLDEELQRLMTAVTRVMLLTYDGTLTHTGVLRRLIFTEYDRTCHQLTGRVAHLHLTPLLTLVERGYWGDDKYRDQIWQQLLTEHDGHPNDLLFTFLNRKTESSHLTSCQTLLFEGKLLDLDKMKFTVKNFPCGYQSSADNDTLTRVTEYDSAQCYDPLMTLVICRHLLDQFVTRVKTNQALKTADHVTDTDSLVLTLIDVHKLIDSGVIPLAAVAMSSEDTTVRQLAYHVIASFQIIVEHSPSIKEGPQLLQLFKVLNNTVTLPNMVLPNALTQFLAQAFAVLLRPSHPHYGHVCGTLLSRPILRDDTLPLWRALWTSVDRSAAISQLIRSTKSQSDVRLLSLKRVTSKVLAWCHSFAVGAGTLAGQQCDAVIKLLEHTVTLWRTHRPIADDEAEISLAYWLQDEGLITWLDHVISSLVQPRSVNDKLTAGAWLSPDDRRRLLENCLNLVLTIIAVMQQQPQLKLTALSSALQALSDNLVHVITVLHQSRDCTPQLLHTAVTVMHHVTCHVSKRVPYKMSFRTEQIIALISVHEELHVTDQALVEKLIGIIVHNHYGHQLASQSMTPVIQWTARQLFRLTSLEQLLLPYLEWLNTLFEHTALHVTLTGLAEHVMRLYYQIGTLPPALTHVTLRAINRLTLQLALRLRVVPELTGVNQRLLSELLTRVTDRGDIAEINEQIHHQLIAIFVQKWWKSALIQSTPDFDEIARRLH